MVLSCVKNGNESVRNNRIHYISAIFKKSSLLSDTGLKGLLENDANVNAAGAFIGSAAALEITAFRGNTSSFSSALIFTESLCASSSCLPTCVIPASPSRAGRNKKVKNALTPSKMSARTGARAAEVSLIRNLRNVATQDIRTEWCRAILGQEEEEKKKKVKDRKTRREIRQSTLPIRIT